MAGFLNTRNRRFPLLRGVVKGDYSDEYRPRSLVPRQRAILRLMTDRPELAMHAKAFTWTSRVDRL